MLPPLSEIIGLPTATSPAELGSATEARFKDLLGKASGGDAHAHAELVRLRVAYLNWAYANPDARLVVIRSRMF